MTSQPTPIALASIKDIDVVEPGRHAHLDIGRLERIEHLGFADFWAAAPPALVGELGIESRRMGSTICKSVRAKPESIMWNHASGLRGYGSELNETVDAVAAYFTERGVRGAIGVAPWPEAGVVQPMLVSRGYEPGYAWAKFARSPERVPDRLGRLPTLGHLPIDRIEPVAPNDKATVDAFGRIEAKAFGVPPSFAPWFSALVQRPAWRCFVGRGDDGAPIAAGAIFVHGQTVWVTWGATLPQARRRGFQSALFEIRRRAAIDLGATLLVTETGERADLQPESSYRNILRAGFQRLYRKPNHIVE